MINSFGGGWGRGGGTPQRYIKVTIHEGLIPYGIVYVRDLIVNCGCVSGAQQHFLLLRHVLASSIFSSIFLPSSEVNNPL